MMNLKIYIPSKILLEVQTQKIISEDDQGLFCLLSKHIDCVRILVPSILTYTINNEEKYVGIDEGILVKCKQDVNICIRNGICKAELGSITKNFEENINKMNEDEKKIRKILTELEVDFLKRYTELKKI